MMKLQIKHGEASFLYMPNKQKTIFFFFDYNETIAAYHQAAKM